MRTLEIFRNEQPETTEKVETEVQVKYEEYTTCSDLVSEKGITRDSRFPVMSRSCELPTDLLFLKVNCNYYSNICVRSQE